MERKNRKAWSILNVTKQVQEEMKQLVQGHPFSQTHHVPISGSVLFFIFQAEMKNALGRSTETDKEERRKGQTLSSGSGQRSAAWTLFRQPSPQGLLHNTQAPGQPFGFHYFDLWFTERPDSRENAPWPHQKWAHFINTYVTIRHKPTAYLWSEHHLTSKTGTWCSGSSPPPLSINTKKVCFTWKAEWHRQGGTEVFLAEMALTATRFHGSKPAATEETQASKVTAAQ